jgi:hypothetical protein
MESMEYVRAKAVSLKTHPEYNERWLQERIADDPAVLGLGDLTVRDVERSQPRAGRLDMLLSDPEAGTRYEVEIQLGATDEAHIIRTIEYWDIEKARYPQYDHVAVIVAEDLTSRFLNVISLFNRAIPLVAIQINALEVGSALTLNSTVVLDVVQRGTAEEDEPGPPTDRTYWEQKAAAGSMRVTDQLLGLVREVTGDEHLDLNYTKHYIGLARDGRPDNFITFRPRKTGKVYTAVKVPRSEELGERLEASGIDLNGYSARFGEYQMRLSEGDLNASRDLLVELIRRASDMPIDEATPLST